jgi:hypothetical protein
MPTNNYGPGFSDSEGPSVAAEPVAAYLGCAPKVDTCLDEGHVCCNSKGDFADGLTSKTTCQYKDDCHSIPKQAATNVKTITQSPSTITNEVTTTLDTTTEDEATSTTEATTTAITTESTENNGANGANVANTMLASLAGMFMSIF